jgi:hypothetical protein
MPLYRERRRENNIMALLGKEKHPISKSLGNDVLTVAYQRPGVDGAKANSIES